MDELTEESLIEVEKLISKLKANQAISDIARQEKNIHLKAEDMAFFLQALENPPKVNAALKEATKSDLVRSKDLRHLLKNYPVGNRTVAEIDAQINSLRNEWD